MRVIKWHEVGSESAGESSVLTGGTQLITSCEEYVSELLKIYMMVNHSFFGKGMGSWELFFLRGNEPQKSV